MAKPVGTAATTRLRKLECDAGCGYIVRVSRTAMDRGLPTCCCGGRLVPAALEDALRSHELGHLTTGELEAHPEHELYVRERLSVEHGQAPRHQRGGSSHLRPPEAIAFERVIAQRRVEARAAQLAALSTFNALAVEPEPIPF